MSKSELTIMRDNSHLVRSGSAFSKPPSVGKKFAEDGEALAFEGASIVCHVPKGSRTFQMLQTLSDELSQKPYAKSFRFLPRSSFHMTIFPCINDQARVPEQWAGGVPLDTPVLEAIEQLNERLGGGNLEAPFEVEPQQLCVDPAVGNTLVLHLKPTTEEDEHRFRALRNSLSELLGIRKPLHNAYRLHFSLAYQTAWLSAGEVEALTIDLADLSQRALEFDGYIEFEAPQLCYYSNMLKFTPVGT